MLDGSRVLDGLQLNPISSVHALSIGTSSYSALPEEQAILHNGCGRPEYLLSSVLTSARNPVIKDIRQAVRKGGLTDAGFCVAEGFNLLAEAQRSGCRIEAVLVAESRADQVGAARVIVVSDELFRSIASTDTTQGVLALVEPPRWNQEDVFGGAGPVVIVDGIQDPGNAGAILRVAEAFGASGAVWLKGSAHAFHQKALRASAGSCFRVPMLPGLEPAVVHDMLGSHNRPLYAAMPHVGTTLDRSPLGEPCAIVIGAEGRGIGPEIARDARPVRIPTQGVESLNAAVAAGILLYEASRQRNRRP